MVSIKDSYKVRSDIPANYGMLFGIKKNGILSVPLDKFARRFETRASNLIKIKDLTHLEVPLNKVAETKEFLKKNKVDLIVIPLEVGELYCNKYSLKELSGVH